VAVRQVEVLVYLKPCVESGAIGLYFIHLCLQYLFGVVRLIED
jgi:hypothetical protein